MGLSWPLDAFSGQSQTHYRTDPRDYPTIRLSDSDYLSARPGGARIVGADSGEGGGGAAARRPVCGRIPVAVLCDAAGRPAPRPPAFPILIALYTSPAPQLATLHASLRPTRRYDWLPLTPHSVPHRPPSTTDRDIH
jgi:hypothetical protein